MKPIILLLLALGCSFSAFCQAPGSNTGQQKLDSIAKAAVQTYLDSIKKQQTTNFKLTIIPSCDSCPTHNPKYLVPGDFIRINVEGTANKGKDSRLWINGYCHKNNAPLYTDNSTLIFQLAPDTGKASPWRPFYTFTNRLFYRSGRDVRIGLGTASVPDSVFKTIKLRVDASPWWVLALCYLLLVAALILMLSFAQRMIRDTQLYGKEFKISYKEPTNIPNKIINIRDVPFSLARTQFLAWLLMIFFGVFHLWIVTDTLIPPTGNILILLTISGTTLFVANRMDQQPGALVTLQTQDPPELSKGFFNDVLYDGTGMSVHRLQLLAFTAFMAVYFIVEVTTKLKMPEFDTTMLTLMGISGGTYVGLKATE